jgi:glycosyltransferase involved in cell wall biosynthesis
MMRPLKGADLLVRALNALPWELRRDTVLLLFGHSGGDVARQVGMQAIELGYLQSDRLKALAYSAADLFVHPSKAESFGLVVLESIACGTPVVCFRVGGLPELVRPEITGMLAAPDDPQGMANQIIALLEDRARLRVISRRCRSVALEEYSLGLQVERYIEVYRQTIASGVGV